MSEKTPNQRIIDDDILRYKSNKIGSSLALLSIVFSCLYFCLLYAFTGRFFATWKIGFSVILTLFSLLITFLASEGIKGYNKKYCIVLLVLAAVQVIRIFGLPMEALRTDSAAGVAGVINEGVLTVRYFGVDLTPSASYVMLVIWLVASATCLVLSAVFGYINCMKLEAHNKKVEEGEINIDATLKQMDEEDAAAAANAAQEVSQNTASGEVQ